MNTKIAKANEITDVKIQYVSLVNAAANKHQFLVTKADGQTCFSSFGRILKTDDDKHYVTGIVYEPMTEDTQGEFMTAEEIEKAAYWYMKNAQGVDVQHSFEPQPGTTVVESWVQKSDAMIGDTDVKAGTWMVTVEVTDTNLWESIQKGEITGFSMGGVAVHHEEDTNLEKTVVNEKKTLLTKMAEFLGLTVKGDVAEIYESRLKSDSFWDAFDALESALRHYDSYADEVVYETDENVIREALTEFGSIITKVLAEDSVVKAMGEPVETSLKKEEKAVNKEELQEIIKSTVAETVGQLSKEAAPEPAPDVEPEAEPAVEPEPATTESVSKEEIAQMIAEAVEKAIEPIRKHTGVPSNLNGGENVEKQEQHYLHGII